MSAISSGNPEQMPTTQQSASRLQSPPTEDAPEVGVVAWGDVVLSEAEHYIDPDGVHVIRSLEFDVNAYDEDFETAVGMFVDNAEDYCSYLANLAREQTARPHELEMLGSLYERVMAIRNERERELSQDLAVALMRKVNRVFGRNVLAPKWRQRMTPPSSSPPSSG